MLQTKIQNFISYLKSSDTSQKYLEKCYLKQNISDPEKRSYQNSYRFLYYLQHGQSFYQTGKDADLLVKPILYFYGMVHLLKACLLTRRPDYPENTSMLAHGVSTRKRKKQDYAFLQDEVKIQHKGLFPYFSLHLCGMEQLPFEKIKMKQLLTAIPELSDLFGYHYGEDAVIQIGNLDRTKLTLSNQLLDSYNMTENSLIAKLSTFCPTIIKTKSNNNYIEVFMTHPLSPASDGPFYYHMEQEAFYLPAKRQYFSTNQEIMNHYLILYNLSMICRYETEWWGDLLHTLPTEDFPFIKLFLETTAIKVPFLLGYLLYQQLQ